MKLKSANSEAVLEFSDVQGDCFLVSFNSLDHTAKRGVDAFTDTKGVARLFRNAAAEWRGWDGIKSWESLEGELRLELTCDKLGHVALNVRIRADGGIRDEWCLEAAIGIEAGQLESIADEADRLWAEPSPS